jgi:tetratricopeptide (TPR) repeat protein
MNNTLQNLVRKVNFLEGEHRYNEAIDVYTSIIALAPETVEAYLNRAIIYFKEDRLDEAIADYSKVIAINPQHYYAYEDRAKAYTEKGEYDKAIADYTTIITLDHEIAFWGYYERAKILQKKNKPKEALADLYKFLELDIFLENKAIYIDNARKHEAAGNYEKAIAECEKSLEQCV